MADDEGRIRAVYDKTGGCCRYCGKQLAIKNYGARGEHGAWVIDHSIPKSKGGTDHMNNLFPACCDCNEEKGDQTGDSFLKKRTKSLLFEIGISPSPRTRDLGRVRMLVLKVSQEGGAFYSMSQRVQGITQPISHFRGSHEGLAEANPERRLAEG